MVRTSDPEEPSAKTLHWFVAIERLMNVATRGGLEGGRHVAYPGMVSVPKTGSPSGLEEDGAQRGLLYD